MGRVNSVSRWRGISPNIARRFVWVDTFIGTFISGWNPPPDKEELESSKAFYDLVHHPSITEKGDDISLYVPFLDGSTRSFTEIILTYLNEDELKAVKAVFDSAFEAALPIVREREQIAREETEAGNAYYVRMYRQSAYPNVNTENYEKFITLKRLNEEDESAKGDREEREDGAGGGSSREGDPRVEHVHSTGTPEGMPPLPAIPFRTQAGD